MDVLLLDKTGTITYGNRQASALWPAPGVSQATLAQAAWLASLADDTPEGKHCSAHPAAVAARGQSAGRRAASGRAA